MNSDIPIVILMYFVVANAMILVNSYLINTLGFKFHYILLFIQYSITFWFMLFTTKRSSHQNLNYKHALVWFHVGLLNVITIYSGSKAIEYFDMGILSVFRSLSLVIAALANYLFFGNKTSKTTLFSFALIIFSSALAANNLSNSIQPNKLYWVIINCFAGVAYITCAKHTSRILSFDSIDVVYYNSALSSPILLVLAACFENAENFVAYTEHHTNILYVVLIIYLSSILATVVSIVMAQSMLVTSVATYLIITLSNRILSIIGSCIVSIERPANLLYLVTSALGILLYMHEVQQPK